MSLLENSDFSAAKGERPFVQGNQGRKSPVAAG